jgi:hypothetical protein
VVDPSTSSIRFSNPLPQTLQIHQVAEEMVSTGGELELFFVRESGRTVGEHLALPQPESKPELPSLSGNQLSPQDAKRREDYAKRLAQYELKDGQRVEECRRRIDAYVKRLESEFSAGRKAKRSAVREALYFAVQFLNAPTPLSFQPPERRVLLVFSDCHENSPESPKTFELPNAEDLTILWVDPEPGSTFPLPGARPAVFATSAQALDFATTLLHAESGRIP